MCVAPEWGGPLGHMEDAEAGAEPAEQAVQAVLQQQGVPGVGQQMQVHRQELRLPLLPDPSGHKLN